MKHLSAEELARRKKINKISLSVIAFSILVICLANCGGNENDTGTPVTATHSEIEAYVMAKEFVKKNLKAPATAEFPSSNEARITKLSDSEFVIKGYVDAQNSFGALLRTEYNCKIVFEENDMARCEDFQFLNN